MCARCSELEEEVAWLKSELGLRINADKLGVLAKTFGASPNTARLILMFHEAKGRPVTRVQIEEALRGEDECSETYVGVYMAHVRRCLGADAIDTIRSHGFRLTPIGAERIGRALCAAAPARVAA